MNHGLGIISPRGYVPPPAHEKIPIAIAIGIWAYSNVNGFIVSPTYS